VLFFFEIQFRSEKIQLTDNYCCNDKLRSFTFEEKYAELIRNRFSVKKVVLKTINTANSRRIHGHGPPLYSHFQPGKGEKVIKKCILSGDQKKLIFFPGPLFNKESESDLETDLRGVSEEIANVDKKSAKIPVKFTIFRFCPIYWRKK